MDSDPVHDMLPESVTAGSVKAGAEDAVRLSAANPGDRGLIVDVRAGSHAGDHGVDVGELQRRLLEFGFVEGARIEVLHEGAIWRDPIAVRVNHATIALRRREAMSILAIADRPA